MADSYWKYAAADGRQQPPPQQQQQQLHSLMGKRPRSDYDLSGGRDLASYYAREDDRGTHLVVKDSDTIGASYDRYLRGTQLSPYAGVESARPMGLGTRLHEDPRLIGMGLGSADHIAAATSKGRDAGLLGGRPDVALPADASNTLFVEGLPSNCSRREVAHIFRPFVGYKEVRLVTKESRHSSKDPLVLCFVDFESPAEAATAKDALQGFHTKPAKLVAFTPPTYGPFLSKTLKND
uniref:nuclear speckle RNA-binding protein A-like isoform X2 n=1 Tax=Erigeron canadensis TaxID=72917 RepID=UPI001CB97096|nr:nuclear speckle RNA-binding protein A-like isoform X2 [Erigeron canadensis]